MCDSFRPINCLIEPEKFRFSNLLELGAIYTFQKFQYFFMGQLVINSPNAKIIKGFTIISKLFHFFLVKPKSDIDEIDISIVLLSLNNLFNLSIKSGLSSLGFIRIKL